MYQSQSQCLCADGREIIIEIPTSQFGLYMRRTRRKVGGIKVFASSISKIEGTKNYVTMVGTFYTLDRLPDHDEWVPLFQSVQFLRQRSLS